MTVEWLFDRLRERIVDESEDVHDVRYDRRFGWPSHYETDPRSAITDLWTKMTVERFDVIR